MKKFIYSFLLVGSLCFAETEVVENEQNVAEEIENSAECIILEDENSIICKYVHRSVPEDRDILVQWIDPRGEISRQRSIVMPAEHISIYDFRYIEGRMKGFWEFRVIEDDMKTTTIFEVK